MSSLFDPSDLWSILAPSPLSQIEEFKFSEKAEAENKYFFASKYSDTFIDVLLC